MTRFCKAIGVGGYPELRIALAADTARSAARANHDLGGDIGPDDDLRQVVGKVAFADARAVEETAEQLDVESLQQVVEAVAGARPGRRLRLRRQRVRRRRPPAEAAPHRPDLLRLERHAHRADLGSGADRARTSRSASRTRASTAETVEALRVAREHGATTVALTNFPRSPITEVADHVLTTAARETTFRSGAMASRIAQLTVIDCLFIGVAQRHVESAKTALEATYEAVSSHRLGARPDGRRRQRENGK